MEQTHAGERHCDAVLVASVDDIVVTYRTACLCYILYAALVSTLDVVAEREESVRTESYAAVLGYPCLLLLHCEHLGLLLEEHLPCSVTQNVVMVLRDIYVDGVVAISATDVVHEGKIHHLRVLAQPPDVSLVAGETCAVDAALLSGTGAECLPVLYEAY